MFLVLFFTTSREFKNQLCSAIFEGKSMYVIILIECFFCICWICYLYMEIIFWHWFRPLFKKFSVATGGTRSWPSWNLAEFRLKPLLLTHSRALFTIHKVLAEPQHTLQNKVIDPKRAQTRGATEVCRKIFVGGLDPNLPEESIREYFGRFGKVWTVIIVFLPCFILQIFLLRCAVVACCGQLLVCNSCEACSLHLGWSAARVDGETNNNNNNKYCSLQSTHIFCPVAIETSGTWNVMAVDLVQEIGRRITDATEDSRETTFLFQRLSMALQQGNAVAFQSTMVTEWNIVAAVKLLSFSRLQALCLWA